MLLMFLQKNVTLCASSNRLDPVNWCISINIEAMDSYWLLAHAVYTIQVAQQRIRIVDFDLLIELLNKLLILTDIARIGCTSSGVCGWLLLATGHCKINSASRHVMIGILHDIEYWFVFSRVIRWQTLLLAK